MDWVTIKVFNESLQAHMLKSKLESEGIPCFLKDDNMVSVHPWASIALGGVKLQVKEVDVDKALLIIKELDSRDL